MGGGGVIVMIISTTGYYWNELSPYRLPLFTDTALTSVGFVYTGHLIKIFFENIKFKTCIATFIIALIMFVLMHSLYGGTWSMQSNSYGMNILAGYGQAILGSTALIALCRMFTFSIPLINFVGKNSLIVLCWHMYLLMGMGLVVKTMKIDLTMGAIFIFVMISILFYPLIFVIKKVFKFIYN